MLVQIAKFTNDAAGLEKTLRFFQAVAQVSGTLGLGPNNGKSLGVAEGHFALARRYFRMFKWIDCWNAAQRLYFGPAATPQGSTKASQPTGPDGLLLLLSVAKWSILGMHLFLEMFTITNVMKVTAASWGPWLEREALKFWFYAIVASILESSYQVLLLYTSRDPASAPKSDGGAGSAKAKSRSSPEIKGTSEKVSPGSESESSRIRTAKLRSLYKQLTIDYCDLLIPGSVVGWIRADRVTVGVAMSISTILASANIWRRVNAVAS